MSWPDLRYAVRSLVRTPGFTLVALATLALGIGANTAIFSVVRAVLLRDYPFQQPDRLLQIGHERVERGRVFGDFSPQDVDDLRAGATQLASVSSYFFMPGVTTRNLSGTGEPVNLSAAMVDGHFFGTLGVSAARGRTFGIADDVPGANRVVVVSDAFWRTHLAADPRAIGSTVQLDGTPFVLIGVMPRAFAFPSAEVQLLMPRSVLTDDDVPHRRGVRWLNVIARLATGATLQSAQAQVAPLMERLARDYPESNEGFDRAAIVPLPEYLSGSVRLPLLALLAAVGLVLLIACVNVAHLMLARGLGRGREMAIRSALGASPGRLLRQLLLESAVLAFASAGIGLLLAWVGVPLLASLAADVLPRASEIAIDPVIAAFSFLAGVAAFLVVGVMPAVRTVLPSAGSALREGRGQSAGNRRLADALVAAESGLAVLLLCGATLALASLWRLTHIDPGLKADNVVTMRLLLQGSRYEDEAVAQRFRTDLLARLGEIPGVLATGASKRAPLSGGGEPYGFRIVRSGGVVDTIQPVAGFQIVMPGYFRTLSIPLRSGREFTAADTTDPMPIIVSQSLAAQAWPGADAVGQRFLFGSDEGVVVGVAADVRHQGLALPAAPVGYVPMAIFQRSAYTVYARVNGSPLGYIARMRDVVHELDPAMPISELGPLTSQIAGSVAQPRLFTLLLGIFGLTALLLASIGVYGVVAQGVSRRHREIGIRMALGARASTVVRMVVGHALRATALGTAVGVIGFLLVSKVVRSRFYEVRATDPLILTAAALILLGAALLAAWLPARLAARVDPMSALRVE